MNLLGKWAKIHTHTCETTLENRTFQEWRNLWCKVKMANLLVVINNLRASKLSLPPATSTNSQGFRRNTLENSLDLCTFFFFFYIYPSFFFLVVNIVIRWNETALGLHVFPIPIPPPTSLSTRSLQVFPEHQVWAFVSCIQPGLVIWFTLDSIHVLMLFSWNIPPSPSPTESKRLFYKSVSLFLFCI